MNFKGFITGYFLLLQTVIMVYCGDTYYEIGIYSNCTGRSNRTQLNIDAGLVAEFNEAMIKGIRDRHRSKINAKLIYKVYDVCDNFTYLADIVQNLILDEKFQIQDEKNYSRSSVIDLFMYTPLEMTSFLKNVFTQIPVYDIDHRIRKDGSVYNPVDGFVVDDFITWVKFAGWEKLTLLTLGNIDFPYSVYYRKTVEALQRMNVCVELYHIDPMNNETKFIKRLSGSTSQNSLVFLFGTSRNQNMALTKIFRRFGRLPMFPIVNSGFWPGSIMVDGKWLPTADSLSIQNRRLEQYNHHMVSILHLKGDFPAQKYNALAGHLKTETAENTEIYKNQIRELSFWGTEERIMILKEKRILKDLVTNIAFYYLVKEAKTLEIKIRDSKFFPYGKSKERFPDGGVSLFSEFLTSRDKSLCKKPVCKPGHHLIYGNVSVNRFAWKCILCPKNTHKPFSGDGRCQTCTGRFNIDNGKRTMCTDPYQNVYIGLSNSEFSLLLTLDLMGIFVTLFSVIVFVVKRKTPMVSVSDYLISMIHMSIK